MSLRAPQAGESGSSLVPTDHPVLGASPAQAKTLEWAYFGTTSTPCRRRTSGFNDGQPLDLSWHALELRQLLPPKRHAPRQLGGRRAAAGSAVVNVVCERTRDRKRHDAVQLRAGEVDGLVADDELYGLRARGRRPSAVGSDLPSRLWGIARYAGALDGGRCRHRVQRGKPPRLSLRPRPCGRARRRCC